MESFNISPHICTKCYQTYFGQTHICLADQCAAPPFLQYEAANDQLGVEPFKTDAIEKQVKSGFGTVSQKVNLTPLKVIFGTEKIPAGATVWVRGELAMTLAESKAIYEIEGQRVIFIPAKEVKLIKRF